MGSYTFVNREVKFCCAGLGVLGLLTCNPYVPIGGRARKSVVVSDESVVRTLNFRVGPRKPRCRREHLCVKNPIPA